MSTAVWRKVRDQQSDLPEPKRAPYYLEIRDGKRKTSYRVNYRGEGLDLRQVLRGEFKSWKGALAEADRLIGVAKYGPAAQAGANPLELVRCEEIGAQLIAESAGQDESTIDGKTRIIEKHLLPWLNEHYPYASSLTVDTWPQYKLFKRGIDPTVALENHVKYFRMIARRVFERGILKQKIRVTFNVKKEEFREKGHVIPAEHLDAMLKACEKVIDDAGKCTFAGNAVWRDRVILQRDTGMRPGEVRRLAKSRVRFAERDGRRYAVIHLLEEDTKTHREREFEVHSARAVAVLWRRCGSSPFLFPMSTDPMRPMDKHLKGWHAMLKRAGVILGSEEHPVILPHYTPHDLRHTYATEMFKLCKEPAVLCYQMDLSLEVAQDVYLHFNAADTAKVAQAVVEARVA